MQLAIGAHFFQDFVDFFNILGILRQSDSKGIVFHYSSLQNVQLKIRILFYENSSLGRIEQTCSQTAVFNILNNQRSGIHFNNFDTADSLQLFSIGSTHRSTGFFTLQFIHSVIACTLFAENSLHREIIRLGEGYNLFTLGSRRNCRNNNISTAALQSRHQRSKFHIGEFDFLVHLLGDVVSNINIDTLIILGAFLYGFKRREGGVDSNNPFVTLACISCSIFFLATAAYQHHSQHCCCQESKNTFHFKFFH